MRSMLIKHICDYSLEHFSDDLGWVDFNTKSNADLIDMFQRMIIDNTIYSMHDTEMVDDEPEQT